MATKVDILKRKIQKDKRVDVPLFNMSQKKGRKITIKIERGEKIVIGNGEKQKVIDFILLDRNEIRRKGEEDENQQILEFSKQRQRQRSKLIRLPKKQNISSNKGKVINLIDDEDEIDEKKCETIEIIDEDEDNEELEIGHIENEDIEEILSMNKKITQKINPFLCQQLGSNKDPRQNRLVQEIQNILQMEPQHKLNLVLDLDETLVNSVWVSSENEQRLESTFRYKMPSNKNILTIYYTNNEGVQKEFISIMRPHLKEFLTEVKKYFNIYVYSHGRKEYVMKLLDKIDPRRDLFNRNLIFKNEGQVNLKTQKDIRNIIPCPSADAHEALLKQTIIVDDIYEVWLEETLKNVVPIKRFQPLNEFLNKNNQCTIFVNHNKQYIRFPKSHQQYFEDIDIQDNSNQFLKGLQRYLITCALQYYNKKLIQKDQKVDIREYLTYQKLMILNKLDINISLLEGDEIYDVFKYISLAIGANIELKNFRYALVNKQNLSQITTKMAQMKQLNPVLTFVDSQWLIDSFFINYQLDIQPYVL